MNPKVIVKKWICIVCNEVFEGVNPPEECPACGATSEQFEEYYADVVTFNSDFDGTVLIIGNCAAGVSAAEAIRIRNKKVNISLISDEKESGYYRPMLSPYISNTHDKNTFYLRDEAWYKDNNISVKLDTKVTDIDTKSNLVTIDDQSSIKYDYLVLANGSSSFVPPIKGANKQNVFTLRNVNDANIIKSSINNLKSCVVIGGGLLGLEAAFELRQSGLDVTVIEFADRILPRQLDAYGSKVLYNQIIKTGIHLKLTDSVTEINGNDKVENITLKSGNAIDCDMVLISTGARSNIDICKDTNIKTDRGIVIDNSMKTNIDNIYAAGDVAQYRDELYQIWSVAIEQGKIAGANVAGDHLSYETPITPYILNSMNTEVFSIGEFDVMDSDIVKSIIITQTPDVYEKFVFENNILIGGVLVGDISKSTILIKGLESNLSIEGFLQKD